MLKLFFAAFLFVSISAVTQAATFKEFSGGFAILSCYQLQNSTPVRPTDFCDQAYTSLVILVTQKGFSLKFSSISDHIQLLELTSYKQQDDLGFDEAEFSGSAKCARWDRRVGDENGALQSATTIDLCKGTDGKFKLSLSTRTYSGALMNRVSKEYSLAKKAN